ncbi:hypothetical protein B1219_00830 [Pseudomonas ogarae]|uniref:AAA family ATPase n=1 Tax=Pseudomonas ogarae (strain DSM 112162 / CECT 30235 / F113) TaxID=1114970 RepID=UPI0009A2900D|nr:DUF3696 domain-containing protein [Pseudomonas ogarae]OPG73650.1 hypothetical protein B1219_00830 [Pseudomonas ogarae]OPG78460.1 hypothetical protein B1218_15460 [Pseudomonas ogarae]
MISKLELKNIKCFNSAVFNLSNLTVFCGANSAGKSTAIQSLLLLRQNYNCGKLNTGKLSLVGEYFSVGHTRDLISHSPVGESLSISIDDVNFVSDLKKAQPYDYHISFDSPPHLDHDLFSADFNYLSAYRLSPQNSYDTNFESDKLDLGIYGQYAIAALVRYGDMPAPNQKLAKHICPGVDEVDDRAISLARAFKEAMKLISADFDIVTSSHLTLDKVSNTFSAGATAYQVRPVNTGFGISNVAPIVLAALCTREGGYLIVENPEVHLHPAAQSSLAALLSLTATCHVQVILETHSDHIVNGIRVFAKENSLENGFVTVNSVRASKSGRVVTEITIDSDGGLSDMDEGFFDQAEKDLLRLF